MASDPLVPICCPLIRMVCRLSLKELFLSLDVAIASRAVFVIASGSDERTETLVEPAK